MPNQVVDEVASPPLVLRYPDAALVARLVEQGAVHARTALETLSVAGRYAREVIAAALVALLEEQGDDKTNDHSPS